MRIAVMGAGALGGYFGGLLARAGEEVTMLTRGAQLEALRANGLTVKSRLLETFTVPVHTIDAADPADNPEPADLILFCVKAYDTLTAAQRIRPLVGSDTIVLSLQNGVESIDRLAEVLDRVNLVAGAVVVSVVAEAPGVIAARAEPAQLRFGEPATGVSPRTEALVPVFERAGINAEASGDMKAVLWQKFLFICALSGVTALARLPLGPLLAQDDGRWLLRAVLEEVAAVAAASGVTLPTGAVDVAFERLIGSPPLLQGSMADDLAAGRRLELEVLNGAIVRLGHLRGVPTPANAVITAALGPWAEGQPRLPSPSRPNR